MNERLLSNTASHTGNQKTQIVQIGHGFWHFGADSAHFQVKCRGQKKKTLNAFAATNTGKIT